MRDYVTIVTNLRNKPGESSDPHGIVEATWLTCQAPTAPRTAPDAGVSIDQIVARQVGKDTPLPSIELCGEPGGAVSYKTPNVGLPLEGNPRKVFTTMFGPGDSNTQRKQLLADTGSLLDYVRDATQSLNSELGASDRALVSDYLESVRDVEGRVQKLEAKANALGQLPDAPLGAPDDFTDLLDVQFEMMALAFPPSPTSMSTRPSIRSRTMARIRTSRTAWRASRPTRSSVSRTSPSAWRRSRRRAAACSTTRSSCTARTWPTATCTTRTRSRS
jgi:hypothetical protein